MSGDTAGLRRFMDPEYTGENRCLPCTVMNVIVGLVGSTTLGIVVSVAGYEWLAIPFAGIAFLLSMTFVIFKGYLVPGTPAVTKRYFPRRLLEAFGKAPERGGAGGTVGGAGNEEAGTPEMDAEAILVGADVLTEQADGADLELTDEFSRTFHEQVEKLDETTATPDRLLEILGIGRGEVSVDEYGTAFRVRTGGQLVGTWESRPAFLADAASAELLRERLDNWEETTVRQRGQLLNGLRLFLTTCPGCSGELSFGAETVESCCSTREVVAVTCEECEARVFEASDVT